MFSFVVEISDLFNDLLDLFHFETAHEAESASLEWNYWRGFLRELFGSKQDGAITSNGDDKINYGIGLLVVKEVVSDLMKGFDGLLLYFLKCSFIEEEEVGTDRMWEKDGDFLDEFEDLLLFVDAADEEDGEFGGHWLIYGNMWGYI